MNLSMDYAAVRQCGSVRQYAAVRAAVCSSARGSVQQCVAVCGSKHGGVRAVRAVSGAVCGSVIGSVLQCGGACVAVRQCMALWQWVAVRCVRLCAAVCVAMSGSARGSVRQYA
jgi:hypothetical protein